MGSKRGERWPPRALSGHQRRAVSKSPDAHRAQRPQDGSGPHSAKANGRYKGILGVVPPPGAQPWLFIPSLGTWRDMGTPDALVTDFEIILPPSLERKRTVGLSHHNLPPRLCRPANLPSLCGPGLIGSSLRLPCQGKTDNSYCVVLF